MANILADLIQQVAVRDPILVSIPMSGKRADPLWEITTEIGDRLGFSAVRALERDKRRSTRASVAQVRRQIVTDEYRLLEGAKHAIVDKEVFLLDDTVTTGFTMTGVAAKLSGAGARKIFPVCMDRSISPRLRQRLSMPIAVCGHEPEAIVAEEG